VQAWTVDAVADALVAPDPAVPVFAGHLQQWFGGSINRSNFVTHDTISFSGTAAGGTTSSIDLGDD